MPDSNPKTLPAATTGRRLPFLDLSVGQLVQWNGRIFRIANELDLKSIVGTDVELGRNTTLPIDELEVPSLSGDDPDGRTLDLSEIADEDWKEANRRFAAIKPLLGRSSVTRADAKARGERFGVSVNTIYNWLNLYRASPLLTSLIARKRGWKKGRRRLDPATEKVLAEVIEDTFLIDGGPTPAQTHREVERRCFVQGVHPSVALIFGREVASVLP